ncbi:MAG: serine/threonine-protein phosphatase [Desulfobacterales bacterium]|jgi:PPM family protein phosphatase|nr:serine/threonine-protein phosphatase [Desulfobacteraceae bacterium]MBT7085984.1 serine/threonine-protein phosphatase [Desulfobacterales bacterium]MBT7698384.1 serine/threonine-protein phosphatase [Desulfobacterales bacterium]
MVVVESAGITDVGQKRKINEDSLFLDDDLGLYIVADGMGGHKAGEVASSLVVETIREYMKRFDDESGDVEELEDSDETLSKSANRILSSIHLANQGVFRVSQSKEDYRGMGSTVSGIYFTDETFVVANVGDSPIFLVHNNNIELISVLHTVVAEQAQIDPEAANRLGREFRHMLTQGMGIKETVEPDSCEIQCARGDVLVISSDGLTDLVLPEEILNIVNKENPDKAVRSLVYLANERGGEDNITVIVIKIKKVYDNEGIMGRIYNAFGKIKLLFFN